MQKRLSAANKVIEKNPVSFYKICLKNAEEIEYSKGSGNYRKKKVSVLFFRLSFTVISVL